MTRDQMLLKLAAAYEAYTGSEIDSAFLAEHVWPLVTGWTAQCLAAQRAIIESQIAEHVATRMAVERESLIAQVELLVRLPGGDELPYSKGVLDGHNGALAEVRSLLRGESS